MKVQGTFTVGHVVCKGTEESYGTRAFGMV